jgi:hypothetical protein
MKRFYPEGAELVLLNLSNHHHSIHSHQPDIGNNMNNVLTTDCGFLVQGITYQHPRKGKLAFITENAGNQEFI